MNTLLDGFVEVSLKEQTDFLKVLETLTRIGIASKKEKKLYQSCHILQKRGKYYIVHFKEMFLLDGKEANFSDEDKGRRNTIVKLLEEWNLLRVVNKDLIQEPQASLKTIKVVKWAEKNDWTLVEKYRIGRKN